MLEFKDHHEAFNAGYALPRPSFDRKEMVFYHMIYEVDDSIPVVRCKIGNAEMGASPIEQILLDAKSSRPNENLQSRVNSIKCRI